MPSTRKTQPGAATSASPTPAARNRVRPRGSCGTRTATGSGHRSARETVKGKQRDKITPKGRKAAVRTVSLPVPRTEPPRRRAGAKPPSVSKKGGAGSQRPAKGKGVATRRVSRR